MNILNEIVRELKEENLIDQVDFNSSNQTGTLAVSNLNMVENSFYLSPKPTALTQQVTESLTRKPDTRYLISEVRMSQLQFLPQPRMRLVRKNQRFSRVCKCCDSSVFILDAYCNFCNERMIGNLLYYGYFMLTAGLVGFIVFYISISNPY